MIKGRVYPLSKENRKAVFAKRIVIERQCAFHPRGGHTLPRLAEERNEHAAGFMKFLPSADRTPFGDECDNFSNFSCFREATSLMSSTAKIIEEWNEISTGVAFPTLKNGRHEQMYIHACIVSCKKKTEALFRLKFRKDVHRRN